MLEKNNSGDITKIVCNYLPPRARAATGVGVFQVHDGNANEVRLSFPKEDRFATWANVQEWMRSLADPFVLCIPLNDSLKTTYNLTPTEVKSLHGINNIWSDAGDMDVGYRADTKLYIKRLTDSDTDMIADANIVSGQYFMVGNDLYKATVNIASGAQIVVGTNATKVSLSEALNQINA